MTEQYEYENWRQISQEEMKELYNRNCRQISEEEMRAYYDHRNTTIVPLIEVKMTEQEALNKIQALVISRRKHLGISYSGYCTKCRNLNARYLTSSAVDGSMECEECFIKRKYSEIAPQITEEDSKEVKEQRAQTVRDYFARRRST